MLARNSGEIKRAKQTLKFLQPVSIGLSVISSMRCAKAKRWFCNHCSDCSPSHLAKPTRKSPAAHQCSFCQFVQGVRSIQILRHPFHDLRKSIRRNGTEYGLFDELSLSALAKGWNDHAARDVVGDFSAVLCTQQMQAAVYGCGTSGRCNDVSLVHIQNIGFYIDARIALSQLCRPFPMRGRPATIQQSCRSQHKCPETKADDFCAALVSLAQRIKQGFGRQLRGIAPAGHDDRFCISETSKTVCEHELNKPTLVCMGEGSAAHTLTLKSGT